MAVNVSALIAQLRQTPFDAPLLDALRAQCEEAREFAVLAEALELHARAAAEAGAAPVALAALHVALGDLYRNQLHDRDRALTAYQTAIELDGAQRTVFAAARELLSEMGSWVQVADLWAREAESLPEGPKRAAALLELASVYEHRLGRRTRAAWTLREAVAAGADDLHVQHHLATLLLDEAERSSDRDESARMRAAAADALTTMAQAVADDYALAYLESALDAVPDHEMALSLLDVVAPRSGRADALAPRWLAAIRAARSSELARALRLKMARAYVSVGQHHDARICLEPLLAAGDQEAIEVGAQLHDTGARPALPGRLRQSDPTAPLEGDVEAIDEAELVEDEGSAHGARAQSAAPAPLDTQARAAVALAQTALWAADAAPSEPGRPRRDTLLEAARTHSAPLTIAELHALGVGSDLVPRVDDLDGSISPDDADESGLRELRAELQKRLRVRDRRGAADVAATLLERGVFDAAVIEALEEHYRLASDYRGLRDLSLRLGRADVFSAEVRGTRLREAVMLSETKLADRDGAALALEELLEVDPTDTDAFHKLKRLRTQAQQWDALADLLERRAAAESERVGRAQILRELGALERDMRGAPVQAISAFAAARAFDPGRDSDDVALSELYVATERWAEAAATYEARLARARPFESPPLLARLASLYEERLGDLARAQRALELWRGIEPHKPDVLESLIRVLDRRGDFAALVEALTAKLAMAPAAERARLHVRIAEIALQHLHDAGRAADAYAEAITTAPHDHALWQQAAVAFDQADRSHELDALLWDVALAHRDRPVGAALLDHLAFTRKQRGDREGAIAAREAHYGATQDRAVLEALVALLREADRPPALSQRLDELARRSEPAVARSLRLERASVLAHGLHDAEAAKAELERLLSELAPDDTAALRMLIDLCAATQDTVRRASAQERLMKLAPSLAARIALAIELVDLYEHDLKDAPGAIRVLTAWTSLEPDNPQPLLRLLPLLTRAGLKRELIVTLDKLARLAIADDEVGEFVLRAARIAIDLDDHDGAWKRLVPRVVEADDLAAETQLRDLARVSARGEQLASLFVTLAQRATHPERERRRWIDAAQAYEQLVGAHDRALEAMLRALAKDLDSPELLSEVERLVERAGAWPRLIRVYDVLVRRASTLDARKSLLMRHAQLLEQRADDVAGALERAWLAFQLDAGDAHVYAETIRLATLAGRSDRLLSGHERRAQASIGTRARIEALLEACALAFLEERPRAIGYVSRAVITAGDDLEALDRIEVRLRALDAKHPPVDGRGLLADLAQVYERLAAERERAPRSASIWLTRAARVHEVTLADYQAAYRTLERATSLAPGDEGLLEELQRVASRAGAWEALATHLQRTADAAIDSRGSSMALRRLALLCERQLNSPSRAADAYEQLVRLQPGDAEAAQRLRACLRDAHRFEELLIAIDRELFLLRPEGDRGALLKQAAEAWEFGIRNRYEALDAWKRVLAHVPTDADALAALERLRTRPRTDDVLLLDGDLTVRPEDLRPSLVGLKSVRTGAADDVLTPSAMENAELSAALAAFDARVAPGATPELGLVSLEGLSSLITREELSASVPKGGATPPPPPPSSRRR